MPPTPFIGISLLIHVCIILVHKIFHWVPRRRIVHKKTTIGTVLLSLFVVTLVFWFVVITAIILIYVSAHDEHSIFKSFNQENSQSNQTGN